MTGRRLKDPHFARWRDQSSRLTSRTAAAAWAREHATPDEPARVYQVKPGPLVVLVGETTFDRHHRPLRCSSPHRVLWMYHNEAPDVPVPAAEPDPVIPAAGPADADPEWHYTDQGRWFCNGLRLLPVGEPEVKGVTSWAAAVVIGDEIVATYRRRGQGKMTLWVASVKGHEFRKGVDDSERTLGMEYQRPAGYKTKQRAEKAVLAVLKAGHALKARVYP